MERILPVDFCIGHQMTANIPVSTLVTGSPIGLFRLCWTTCLRVPLKPTPQSNGTQPGILSKLTGVPLYLWMRFQVVCNFGQVGRADGVHGCAHPEGGCRTWNGDPAKILEHMTPVTDILLSSTPREGKSSSDWLLEKLTLPEPLWRLLLAKDGIASLDHRLTQRTFLV